MAKVNQVYELVNEVASQTLGEKAVAVIDSTSLISLGDSVFASSTDTENFMDTLVDRIGATVFSVRNYQGVDSSLIKTPFEFGCILQKIYIDLPEAKPNNAWEIGKEAYSPAYAPVIKASVKQKLFNLITTWEIDVTIPDFMLKTAFESESKMGAFISAIFVVIDNRMQQALENCVDITRAGFIARKISGGKTCGAINLLEQYNTLTTGTLTVATCLRNVDFLKWATAEIGKWASRMGRLSELFNEEGYQRHTPKENLVINVLQDFSSTTNAFLQADTYHDEMVKLPNYREVPYWQGSGTDYAFESTSSINMKIGKTTGETPTDIVVAQTGIVAVMYDDQAMGVTLTRRNSTTERNNKDEYTNYYNKASFGYFNDMSENGIVFYIADEVEV